MSICIEIEQIETALNTLPLQSRTMLQLLLLQYIDVTRRD